MFIIFYILLNFQMLSSADLIAHPAPTQKDSFDTTFAKSANQNLNQQKVLPAGCLFLIHEIKIGASPSIEKLYICAEKNRPAKKLVEYFKDIKVFRMKNPEDKEPLQITDLKFEPHEFLIVPSHTGAMIIENVLVGKKRKEVIRHEVFCQGLKCDVKPAFCLPRHKWSTKEISELRTNDIYKDSRERFKKLGCK